MLPRAVGVAGKRVENVVREQGASVPFVSDMSGDDNVGRICQNETTDQM